METRVGPQTPYEVYCYDCRVTFPVGTRRCIHCGRPIGAGPIARGPLPLMPRPAAETHEDLELPPQLSGRKLGGMSLWVLLALAAALSRFCTGN
jgi:hypothetical protein